MTAPNLSIAQLEHLLELTKKKLAMTVDLEKIGHEIASFFSGADKPPASSVSPPRRTKRPASHRKGHSANVSVWHPEGEDSRHSWASRARRIVRGRSGRKDRS
jgi:hypothetical protein